MTMPTGTPAQHDVRAALLAHLHTRQAERGQVVSMQTYTLIAGLSCLAAELATAISGNLAAPLVGLLLVFAALMYFSLFRSRNRLLDTSPPLFGSVPEMMESIEAHAKRDLPALMALKVLSSAALRQEHQALQEQIVPLKRRYSRLNFVSVISIFEVSVPVIVVLKHREWLAGLITVVITGLCLLKCRQLDTLDALEFDASLLRQALWMQGEDPEDDSQDPDDQPDLDRQKNAPLSR